MDSIRGTTITFNHYVLICSNECVYVEKLIIKDAARQMLEDGESTYFFTGMGGELKIDATDCGDNITIHEKYLDDGRTKIYVTKNAWEANYQSYSNVIPVE